MSNSLPVQRPVDFDIRKRSSQYPEFHLTCKTTSHFPSFITSYGMWWEFKNSGEVDVFLSINFKILNNFQKNVANANVWNIPFRVLHAIRFPHNLATHSQLLSIDISLINVEIKRGKFCNYFFGLILYIAANTVHTCVIVKSACFWYKSEEKNWMIRRTSKTIPNTQFYENSFGGIGVVPLA